MGVASCCVKVKLEIYQKNGRIEPIVKDGRIIQEIGEASNKAADEDDDIDAAVDFALKRDKSGAKENHHIKELIFSASSLPSALKVKPNTFAAIYFNLYSLDEHDKKAIGKLSD